MTNLHQALKSLKDPRIHRNRKHKPEKAVRASLTDYKKESWMTNLPLYAINTI